MLRVSRAVLVVVLALAVCLTTQAATEPVAVKVVPLEKLIIQPEASAPATVVSLGDSRIAAEINAPVVAIPVRVGEVVEAGGTLVELDCGDYELSVAELKARLDGVKARIAFASQQVKRARSLARQNTMSRELREQRESELDVLVAERAATQANLAMARRKLGKCTVRTPFKAAVLERLISVGEFATLGTPLARVLDLEHLEVTATVPTRDVDLLERARQLLFRHGGRDYPVKPRALSPVIDTRSRTRESRLLFVGEAARPGASGRLVWSNGTALPADLLVRRDRQLGVLLAENGKAAFHPLPKAQEGRPALVDLPATALIITEGRFGLNDGDSVTLVD